MNTEQSQQCQAATKPLTKMLMSTSTTAVLLELNPKADTHFTCPQTVEGLVDPGTAVSMQPMPKPVCQFCHSGS